MTPNTECLDTDAAIESVTPVDPADADAMTLIAGAASTPIVALSVALIWFISRLIKRRPKQSTKQ